MDTPSEYLVRQYKEYETPGTPLFKKPKLLRDLNQEDINRNVRFWEDMNEPLVNNRDFLLRFEIGTCYSDGGCKYKCHIRVILNISKQQLLPGITGTNVVDLHF